MCGQPGDRCREGQFSWLFEFGTTINFSEIIAKDRHDLNWDPDSPVVFEPFPNGGRINMVAYGGTLCQGNMTFYRPRNRGRLMDYITLSQLLFPAALVATFQLLRICSHAVHPSISRATTHEFRTILHSGDF
jgi:hypothetical protein